MASTNLEGERLRAAQVELVFSQTAPAVLGGILAVGLYATVFIHVADTATLLVWSAVHLIAYSLRAGLYLAYRRKRDEIAPITWERLHLAGTLVTGSTWGASWFLLVPADSPLYLLFATVWAVGLGAAAVGAYSVHIPTLLAFYVPTIAPGFLFLFGLWNSVTLSAGAGLVLNVFVTLRATMSIHRSTVDAIRLNFALKSEIEERRRIEEQLRQLSQRDGLTGLANRHHLNVSLESEWRRARREGQPVSLILMDVDYFKPYNDTYGHLEGDRCLTRIGGVLRDALHRDGDLAARYGGEELVVLLPATDASGAQVVAESIRRSVASMAIPHAGTLVQGCNVVTISAGIATLIPSEGEIAETLIRLADKALYRAKSAGRNRVETYNH